MHGSFVQMTMQAKWFANSRVKELLCYCSSYRVHSQAQVLCVDVKWDWILNYTSPWEVSAQVVEKRNGITEIDLLVHVCSHNYIKHSIFAVSTVKSHRIYSYLVYMLEVLKVVLVCQECIHHQIFYISQQTKVPLVEYRAGSYMQKARTRIVLLVH